MDPSSSVTTTESFEDHLAGLGQGFLAVLGKHGENPAQKRILSRAQVVEHIGESATGFGTRSRFGAQSAGAGGRRLERNTIVRHRHDSDGKPRSTIRQLNCYDFSNYAG
jgi:hypothetical protein